MLQNYHSRGQVPLLSNCLPGGGDCGELRVLREDGSMMPPTAQHEAWMDLALAEARGALSTDDVPIGAVVIGPDGTVIGTGRNEREASGDPTAHAEVVAIRQAAAAAGEWRLEGCTLVVTLEPCAMCAGAIVLARIPRVVFGAWDEKAGASGSVFDILRERRLNHWVEVFPEVREAECAKLLTDFFGSRRSG